MGDEFDPMHIKGTGGSETKTTKVTEGFVSLLNLIIKDTVPGLDSSQRAKAKLDPLSCPFKYTKDAFLSARKNLCKPHQARASVESVVRTPLHPR